MAGRTRRPSKPATTEAAEPEVAEVEGTDIPQEEADTEAPETNEEADVTTVAEDTTSTEAVESEAAQAEATPAAQPEAAQPEKQKTPDEYFGEFKSIVADAIEVSDVGTVEAPGTGVVPEANMAKVLDSYRALPNTAKKSEAKAWIADVMRDSLMNRKMGEATAYANINKAVNEVGTRRATAAPARTQVSPTESYIGRIAALALANKFTPQPEGLDENWVEQFNALMEKEGAQVDAYKAYLTEHAAWAAKPEAERGDEPKEPEDVSQVLKDAAKLGQGKAVGGRRASGGARRSSGGGGGVRRDVKKHIEEFLDTVESGTEHPISAIANFKSSEYPEGDASPGAVAARLFPGEGKPSTVEGFEQVTDGGTRKIRKI
ncbi:MULTISPECIES: hypothetical protein [Streptomyces]|uniref:hypothetical protein n=1 Tax=Streptomyces TaxID=1883 RepID=UPI0036584FFB